MQKTRQQILEYLSDHSKASTREIASFLDQTPANIRYHLDILLKAGLIQISAERKTGAAGRPILLFDLSGSSLGDNLPYLAAVLLKAQFETVQSSTAANRVARIFLDGVEREDWKGVQLFNQAIAILDEFGYLASWKATREGPQVELRHCPYRDLALNHPQLCQIDEKMLSELFQINLVLTKRREFGKNPYAPCVFSIQTDET